MAISTVHQRIAPTDLETLDSLVALFAQTGHPVGESTLRRLLKAAGVPVYRLPGDRKDRFSHTEALIVHRDYVTSRARSSS